MKPIKILIFLSLIFGSYAVYSQESNTEVKKSDLEKKTELTESEIKVASQPQVLKAEEENPATAKAPITSAQKQNDKKDDIFIKSRPYPNELDESKPQQTKPKGTPVISADNKSERTITPANVDPKKK